jgi:hypothetical protein
MLRSPLFVAPLAIVAAATSVGAQTVVTLITPAEIEKATGIKGIHEVRAGQVPGAGAGMNFADANNQMVVMINTGPAAYYARVKAQTEMEVAGMKMPMKMFHAAVAGIGDEAFDSPDGPQQYVLYVKKGTQAISFTTYQGIREHKPVLTMEQVKAIAKIVVSRM